MHQNKSEKSEKISLNQKTSVGHQSVESTCQGKSEKISLNQNKSVSLENIELGGKIRKNQFKSEKISLNQKNQEKSV